jgi:hypothetical protein
MLAGLASKSRGQSPRWVRPVRIDGLPGYIAYDPWDNLQTMALMIEDGRIIAYYTVRNPDKLIHVERIIDRPSGRRTPQFSPPCNQHPHVSQGPEVQRIGSNQHYEIAGWR